MPVAAQSRRRRGRPARLSRDLVLRAALDIADRDGLGAVTMQRVGEALGAESMSLYRHVRNKEDLIDGLVDLVFAETEVPSPAEPWRAAMRRRAMSVHDVLGRHPWAVALMESRAHPGPANLAHHDAVLANLFAAGFSSAQATRIYNLIDSYVFGFTLQETSLPIATHEQLSETALEMLPALPAGLYPHLERVAVDLIASGFRYSDEFEFGLDLIFDGFEAQEQGPTRAAR